MLRKQKMFQFNFQKNSQVPKIFFQKRKELSFYLKELRIVLQAKNYGLPESFLVLPEEPVKELSPFKQIFLVGIGGSSLGAQAIYYALKNKKNLNTIFFLDSLNPLFLKKIFQGKPQNIQKIAICLVSESGRTLEPIVNFFILQKILKEYQPKIFVVTKEDSPLANFAIKKKWQVFFLPKAIIGRYSIFSNSGILPLGLVGINTKELLSGAKMANEFCLSDDPFKNPAVASALTIFYHWEKGKNIYINFVFPPDLEFFGKWYCQLMAESLGKEQKGITPMVSVGTADFHSLAQLYLDGPKDKLINFIFFKNLYDFSIPDLEDFKKIFSLLQKKKIWQINSAILEGMKKAFLKKKIPFTEIILERLDEKNLGFLLQMKMIEIILLAKLMKVNGFNQPAVELYKRETKNL